MGPDLGPHWVQCLVISEPKVWSFTEPGSGHLIWADTGPLYSFPLNGLNNCLTMASPCSSIWHGSGPPYILTSSSEDPESGFHYALALFLMIR